VVSVLGTVRVLSRQTRSEEETLFDRDSAAERNRDSHPRPRAQQHAAGHPDPLSPHEGRGSVLVPRHRPRRHRHRGARRKVSARKGEHRPRPARARSVHRPRLEVEGRIRRQDHPPAPHAGLLLRLGARALHHGRRAFRRRPQGVRRAL